MARGDRPPQPMRIRGPGAAVRRAIGLCLGGHDADDCAPWAHIWPHRPRRWKRGPKAPVPTLPVTVRPSAQLVGLVVNELRDREAEAH